MVAMGKRTKFTESSLSTKIKFNSHNNLMKQILFWLHPPPLEVMPSGTGGGGGTLYERVVFFLKYDLWD